MTDKIQQNRTFLDERCSFTESATAMNSLLVSIVCYNSDKCRLKQTLNSLLNACAIPLSTKFLTSIDILLVDNGPFPSEQKKISSLLSWGKEIAVEGSILSAIGQGENIGFGAGHNLALSANPYEFHLILNPDVELSPDALVVAVEFMLANKDCGIIAPAIFDGNGKREYLCKRYPTVFDLLMRGFAPRAISRLFRSRLDKYEMRDLIANEVVWNPPIISGCFMFARTSVLRALNGFDPSYFLYFEDFDLSLRAAKLCKIAYVPAVKIVHHGGYASRKGLKHILMFIRSATTFFNRHGWKWF